MISSWMDVFNSAYNHAHTKVSYCILQPIGILIETCDSIANSTAPFASASADDEIVAIPRVEVGRKERIGNGQLGRRDHGRHCAVCDGIGVRSVYPCLPIDVLGGCRSEDVEMNESPVGDDADEVGSLGTCDFYWATYRGMLLRAQDGLNISIENKWIFFIRNSFNHNSK